MDINIGETVTSDKDLKELNRTKDIDRLIYERDTIVRTITSVEEGYYFIEVRHVDRDGFSPSWSLTNPQTLECIKEALIRREQQIEEELLNKLCIMDIKNINEAVRLDKELKELNSAMSILSHAGNVIVREQNAQEVFAMLKNEGLVSNIADAIRERITEINERIKEL